MDKVTEIAPCAPSRPMVQPTRHRPMILRVYRLRTHFLRLSCFPSLILRLKVRYQFLDQLYGFFMRVGCICLGLALFRGYHSQNLVSLHCKNG